MRSRVLSALVALALIGGANSVAVGAPLALPVECWVENHTPSVAVGAWASYTVHASGGTGTYAVTFSFGDGTQQQGTYSSNEIDFSHVFESAGTFEQTVTVDGASSSDVCMSTTDVY